MRREFHPLLLEYMRKDERIVVIVGDLGFGMWDKIKEEFPTRFFNANAAEQAMLGMGVGFALEGFIPVCYSITPFLLYRPAEFIRNYLNHEQIPVKLLGGGRSKDYHDEGFTHYCGDDIDLMGTWPNIRAYWPKSVADLPAVTDEWLYNNRPAYLNLKR